MFASESHKGEMRTGNPRGSDKDDNEDNCVQ